MKTNETTAMPMTGATGAERPARCQGWELTPAAFHVLLAALHPEPEHGGAEYVRIHERLSKFFECRGCVTPEELADETLNRVARKLMAGETIQTTVPLRYCYGVARNVLREYFAQHEPLRQSLDELPGAAHPREDPGESQRRLAQRLEKELWLDLLAQQVQQLPAASRTLLEEYGWGESHARIARRKALAAQLEITPNALKIRAYRIRATLEKRLLNSK